MPRRWFIAGVAAAALVGIAIGITFHRQLTGGSAAAKVTALPTLYGQATWAAGKRPAPAVALRDQHARPVTLASLRGRTVALTFLDSHCKEACPIEGRMLGAAVRQTSGAARPQLLVVSVNPADTPASVARAIHRWRLPADTIWLLGARARLKPVWNAYRITVDPVSGDIVHSTAVYLIDRHGFERAGFLMPFVPAFVADDFRALEAERS